MVLVGQGGVPDWARRASLRVLLLEASACRRIIAMPIGYPFPPPLL